MIADIVVNGLVAGGKRLQPGIRAPVDSFGGRRRRGYDGACIAAGRREGSPNRAKRGVPFDEASTAETELRRMRSDDSLVLFWFFFFVAAWIALAVGSSWFFSRSGDVALKRRVMRWSAVGGGVLFVGVALAISRQPWVLSIVVPAVVLVTVLNLRLVTFCSVCGATRYPWDSWSRRRGCSRCGASLDEASRPAP
jgi:hypothetical protein